MKTTTTYSKTLYIITALLFMSGGLYAQSNNLSNDLARIDSITGYTEPSQIHIDSLADIDLIKFLPPLNVLIDSALVHSPQIDFFSSEVTRREYEVGIVKKDWARSIIVGYSQTAGTFGNTLSDQLNTGYQFSINVAFPLSTFYGRGDRVGAAEAILESAKNSKADMQMQVRNQVVELYNQLMLSHRLLQIHSDARQTAIMLMEIAQKQFREGELPVSQFSNTTDLFSSVQNEYEKARTGFETSYLRLERLVGVPFNEFPKF